MLSEHARRPGGRIFRIERAHVILLAILVLAGLLYLHHDFAYFLHDDEGSYAYAAWRISLGEVPYRDFLTPQMPAFLYWGGAIVHFFGRSLVPLRLASMATMLLAAWLLYAANREFFGAPVALLSVALLLAEPDAFHNARLFRPEALMLAFQMGGLCTFILGEKRRRLAYTALAGVLFGLSTLSKLFGVLPLAGCFLYLLYAWRRERRPLQQVLWEGLALALPALLVVGATALVFTRATPYFFTAVFEHHAMQRAEMPLLDRVRKGLVLYRSYVTGQPVAVALAAVGAWLTLRRKQALSSLLLWLVPTALVYLALSRDLDQRHLTHLAPALATLAAVAMVRLFALCSRLFHKSWLLWAGAGVLGVGVVLGVCYPWLVSNALEAAKAEDDSTQLSALIQRIASSDQLVISDYPGLAFLAGRRSTYWAAGLSGGATNSGQIRGVQLAEEIERQDVAAIVIHVSGGADHMVTMVDYPDFLRYVQSRYSLVEKYTCGYQGKVFDVYARCDLLPAGCEANPVAPDTLFGGSIELRLPGCPADVCQGLWTVVQWQDGTGVWHDVEGWQGAPEASSQGVAHKLWAVSPHDLGKGPFRWLVLRGGEVLATSEPFQLPALPGDVSRVDLALSH